MNKTHSITGNKHDIMDNIIEYIKKQNIQKIMIERVDEYHFNIKVLHPVNIDFINVEISKIK
jgi:hypothetical protein